MCTPEGALLHTQAIQLLEHDRSWIIQHTTAAVDDGSIPNRGRAVGKSPSIPGTGQNIHFVSMAFKVHVQGVLVSAALRPGVVRQSEGGKVGLAPAGQVEQHHTRV